MGELKRSNGSGMMRRRVATVVAIATGRCHISSLVVGLGNVGDEYARTRHNVGFMALDHFAGARQVTFGTAKHGASTCRVGNSLMVRPTTFMNLSGAPVAYLARYYKVPPARVLVLVDCVSLPLGRVRLARGGSSAGQKGIQSLIDHLGTSDFPRIRMGIGRPKGRKSVADFVLDNFSRTEEPAVVYMIQRADMMLQELLASDFEIGAAQNKYN